MHVWLFPSFRWSARGFSYNAYFIILQATKTSRNFTGPTPGTLLYPNISITLDPPVHIGLPYPYHSSGQEHNASSLFATPPPHGPAGKQFLFSHLAIARLKCQPSAESGPRRPTQLQALRVVESQFGPNNGSGPIPRPIHRPLPGNTSSRQYCLTFPCHPVGLVPTGEVCQALALAVVFWVYTSTLMLCCNDTIKVSRF